MAASLGPDEPGTFLVVDDEPVNVVLLEALLAARGFGVITAASGEEAVERFRENAVDMVLMDILMPGVDGYEATRRIKALDPEGFVPVLFITALSDEQRLAQCIEAGGEDFVTKPINRVQLNAKIDAWLRTRTLYRTVAEQRDALQAHQRRLEHEQEIAERIIARATASPALEAPGLYYHYRPAAILSGDLLLAEYRPNGSLLILLGDFTGHGIGAAVGVPSLASAYYEAVGRGADPAEMLDELNDRLCRGLPSEVFLTAALIEVDPRRRRVGVWNAGMPPVWLIRGATVRHRFRSSGLPLGVVRDVVPGRRQLDHQELPAGAYLYACSDGVVEATDGHGQMYSAEGVEATLTGAPGGSGFTALLERLEAFRAAAEPSDDTTLVALDLDRLCAEGRRGAYGAAEAAHWRSEIALDARTLGHINPVPAIMNMLVEIGAMAEHRQSLYVVIAELYTNALEHGLLQLDSAVKAGEAGFDDYYERRAQALAALETGEIHLRVHCDPVSAHGHGVVIEVEDSGEGFDYQRLLEASDPARHAAAFGRGLLLVRSLCDEIEYFPPGNRVRVRYTVGGG